MSRRTAKVISRGILVASIAMIVTDVGLLAATDNGGTGQRIVVVGDPNAPGMEPVRADLEERLARGELSGVSPIEPVIFGGIALIWAVTGSLIVSRQPRNLGGWIFCIVAASVPVNGLAFAYVVYGARSAEAGLPGHSIGAILGEYSFASIALIPLLFLLFPDGRPPSPRWAWAVRLLVVGLASAVVAFALQPGPFNNYVDAGILYENPLGVAAFADGKPGALLIQIGVFMMLGTSLATVLAVRQRFRQAVGEERQQMRWLVWVATLAGVGLAFVVLLAPVAVLLGLGDEDAGGGPPVFDIFWSLTALTIFIGIPFAYLVALLRYRLWDLDLVIRKAVVFGIVATGITVLAVLVVLIVPVAILGTGLTGWELGLLAFGVAIGFLVGPLRGRARRLADRIVYRQRATPYEVLSAFSERVGETYSTEDVLPRMVQVLASGTGASSARVLLRVGTELHEVARWPEGVESAGDEHTVPVTHLGEELGVLAVTMPANDPMDPSKERLVRDLASQAGLVLRNVRLIEELRASRQRLVTAQDEERRKIERNLHDGAQQQLVALAVQLKLARTMIDRDPPKAGEMLDALQSSATEAIEDLRDLARGIYPPLLADQGLEAALEAQARKSPVPVVVETGAIGRYSRDVESAVYFCTLEALNNVSKYAGASGAVVRLAQSNGQLTFSVTDDGRGFDPEATGPGTGLQGMADRLDAIGGAFDVVSAPGAGTTVTGRVPVGGAA